MISVGSAKESIRSLSSHNEEPSDWYIAGSAPANLRRYMIPEVILGLLWKLLKTWRKETVSIIGWKSLLSAFYLIWFVEWWNQL